MDRSRGWNSGKDTENLELELWVEWTTSAANNKNALDGRGDFNYLMNTSRYSFYDYIIL